MSSSIARRNGNLPSITKAHHSKSFIFFFIISWTQKIGQTCQNHQQARVATQTNLRKVRTSSAFSVSQLPIGSTSTTTTNLLGALKNQVTTSSRLNVRNESLGNNCLLYGLCLHEISKKNNLLSYKWNKQALLGLWKL